MNTVSDETVHRLLCEQIEELWGRGRLDLVDSNYATNVTDHIPVAGQAVGRTAMKQVVADFRAGIPDLRMTLHKTLAAGGYGTDVWTLQGTHGGPLLGREASGAAVEIGGIDMVRVEDGRIADLWHVEEMAQLGAQIGAADIAFGAPADAAAVPAASTAEDYQPGSTAIVPGEEQFTELEHRNLAIARRHIEEIWARGRSELCWEMYHPDAVDHNPAPGQRPGISGIVDVLGWLREAVPDLRMQIQCYVIDGDWIADRWVMTGTHTGSPLMGHPAQGKSFRINGMDVAHLDADGLITDIWHVEEFGSLLQQVTG